MNNQNSTKQLITAIAFNIMQTKIDFKIVYFAFITKIDYKYTNWREIMVYDVFYYKNCLIQIKESCTRIHFVFPVCSLEVKKFS